MEKKRLTAIKIRIRSLVNGKYVKQEGFNPNYVITTSGLRISRVRVLGTVVNKFISEDRKFGSVTLDDSSDTIRIRAFGGVSILDNVNVGSIVDLFGKVREYQGEVYIIPEVITEVDPNMEILRELELRDQERKWNEKRKIVFEYQKQSSDVEELKKLVASAVNEDDVETILLSTDEEQEPEESSDKKKVLEFIEKLDKGDGCNYSELLETIGIAEDVLDTIVNDLLTEGVCFEPRPGKIKKL